MPICLQVDANGTKEENVRVLTSKTEKSVLWREMIGNGETRMRFVR